MKIKRITLSQSETGNYNKCPIGLDGDFAPYFDFKYPFSSGIHLDCERAVFLLNEKGVESDFCKHLDVVFVPEKEYRNSELSDYTFSISEMKYMRFVNVYVDKEAFNKMNDKKKRRCILDKICEAVILVTSLSQKEQIRLIFDEIYNLSEETECEFLGRKTKRYSISVKFKSSLKGRGGYEALLYIKNNKTNKESCNVLFSDAQYADLEYRIHQIVIKNGKCEVRPKYCETVHDEVIFVDINV